MKRPGPQVILGAAVPPLARTAGGGAATWSVPTLLTKNGPDSTGIGKT